MSAEAGGCCGGHSDHEHDEAFPIEPQVLDDLASLEMEFEKAEVEARKSTQLISYCNWIAQNAISRKIPL